jgi:hypothetical protein
MFVGVAAVLYNSIQSASVSPEPPLKPLLLVENSFITTCEKDE